MKLVPNIQVRFDGSAKTVADIILLQQKNLRKNLTPEEIKKEGFVFVEHDPKILQSMADLRPHVVAYEGDQLAGYTLCMTKAFGTKIPELVELFQKTDHLKYENKELAQSPYIVCGQTCVAKEYRGLDLLRKMYSKMAELKNEYQYCITEISFHNTRSLHVHKKIGFEIIHEYLGHEGEPWAIVLWNW